MSSGCSRPTSTERFGHYPRKDENYMLDTSGKAIIGTAPVVAAKGVSRVYGEGDAQVTALHDVDVAFQPGTFSAVMGPSGSGKSTLMHILAGLDKPTTGVVTIDGTAINQLNDKKLTLLRRREIGFVF